MPFSHGVFPCSLLNVTLTDSTLASHRGVGVATARSASKYDDVYTRTATSRTRRRKAAFVRPSQGGENHTQPDYQVVNQNDHTAMKIRSVGHEFQYPSHHLHHGAF